MNKIDSSPQLAVAVDIIQDESQRPLISPRARTPEIKDNGILRGGQNNLVSKLIISYKLSLG